MAPCITPLHLTFCRGTQFDVRQLHEILNVDPHALHRRQHSQALDEFVLPIICAAEAGHHNCLEVLLERGASIEAVDKEGRQAIYYAVRSGSGACVELLVKRGAEVNFVENGEPTTRYLEMACIAGRASVVEVLLRYGALRTDPSMYGLPVPDMSTPMTLAVVNGRAQCLKWLILYGAPIDLSHLPYHRNEMRFANNLFHVLTNRELKCSVEERKDMLRIVHEFGFPNECNFIAMMQANIKPSANNATLEALIAYMKQLRSTPRSLQSASRITLMRALGQQNYAIHVKNLNVAMYNRKISECRLITYLYFKDD